MSLLAAIEFVDMTRLPSFLLGFGFNSVAIAILATLTCRRSRSRSNYIFILVVINIVVFFVTYLMSAAAVSVNVGFGLFALFGILRFRTGTLPVLEITYLFAAIALAALNALALTALTVVEAVIVNVVIIGVLELLGGRWLSHRPIVHSLVYERIELVHPARRAELIADLELRTGLRILGVEVHQMNFLNDTASISIHAHPAAPNTPLTHAIAETFER